MPKKKQNKLTLNLLQCPFCKDWVFSRYRRDYRSCSCKFLSVDGGFDYRKINYDPNQLTGNTGQLKYATVKHPITKQELYNDWNKYVDSWGIHKTLDDFDEIVETGELGD